MSHKGCWVRFRVDKYVFPDRSTRRAARVPANEPVWLEGLTFGTGYVSGLVQLTVRTEHGKAMWTCYLCDLRKQLKCM